MTHSTATHQVVQGLLHVAKVHVQWHVLVDVPQVAAWWGVLQELNQIDLDELPLHCHVLRSAMASDSSGGALGSPSVSPVAVVVVRIECSFPKKGSRCSAMMTPVPQEASKFC